ncbi:DoxX family protein [Candidatus Uhrbacteria bacterium]|nr:DoxX family protein [Candidatus Uhrbacteria bacterium]
MEFFASLLQYNDLGLAFVRIVVGIIFLKHGKMKFGMWKMQASEQMPMQMLNIMRVLSIVESVAGLALILGLFVQLAAVTLGIIMLGAIYFKVFKWKKTFAGDGGWEFDLILLAANLALILSGPGAWSLDRFLVR